MRARIPVSLNVIRVDKPCPASWEKMRGDERVRFCEECSLHVYNLSAMTRDAAEALMASGEGRLCVRYFQRADGTVITQDCGGGLRRAIKRGRILAATAAAFLLSAMLAPLGFGSASKSSSQSSGTPALPAITGRSSAIMGDVVTPPPMMGKIAPVMGEVAAPPTTQPATAPSTRPSEDVPNHDAARSRKL
jgi:hypothetical protein